MFTFLAIVLITTIAFAETNSVPLVSTNISITPTNLAQLLALPPEQLEKVDIARIDLLLAEGLPSSTNLDVEQCLKTLDEWAGEVKMETERNYHRFVEHSEKFQNSLGRYRMAVMAAVLCQDLRVHYARSARKNFPRTVISPKASLTAKPSNISFQTRAISFCKVCFPTNDTERALRCHICM